MDPSARLESERLWLEPLQPEHADEVFPLLDDPRLHEFIGGEPATLEDLRARYEGLADQRSADGKELWLNWIVRVRATGVAVGTVQATVTAFGSFIAWVIGSRWQGQGFAGEAAGLLVRWLLDDDDVESVTALVAPGHIASERVAARSGLSPTGEVIDGERVWRATKPTTDP